ncbi:hypothetical protein D3C87_2028740 [compost metagenome]
MPQPNGFEPLNGQDPAIFTSGKPDFVTRRLMQGFGLTVTSDVIAPVQTETSEAIG